MSALERGSYKSYYLQRLAWRLSTLLSEKGIRCWFLHCPGDILVEEHVKSRCALYRWLRLYYRTPDPPPAIASCDVCPYYTRPVRIVYELSRSPILQ